LITLKLKTMAQSPTVDPTSKHKAISALLPYAIYLEKIGVSKMIDEIFRVARTPYPWNFMWRYIEHYMATLLSKSTPPSLNRATILLSPYIPWDHWDRDTVAGWAAAALAVPYSEDFGRIIVDTLLLLASTVTLRPHIPNDVWAWLKKQPSLPPVCQGRDWGTDQATVRHIRELGDLDILKSYLLLVLSEWDALYDSGFSEIQVSIAVDLGGIGMQHHRRDLIRRLDYIIGELNRGLEHFRQYKPWIGGDHVQRRRGQYRRLREILLEVDRGMMEILAGLSHSG
jgi:hypothetical protein